MANGVNLQQFVSGIGRVSSPKIASQFQSQFGRQITQPELQEAIRLRGQIPRQAAPQQAAPQQIQSQTQVPAQQSATSLTLGSGQFLNQPFGGQQPQQFGNLQDAFSFVQEQFPTRLSDQKKEEIRAGVEAQFAPVFAEQERVNALRGNLFEAQRAQAGDVGFGQSGLGREGRVSVAQAGADALGSLRNRMEAEIRNREAAALGEDISTRQSQFGLANQLLQQQIGNALAFSQENRALANQRILEQQAASKRAQSVLDFAMENSLDPTALNEVGTSFDELASSLGISKNALGQALENKRNAQSAQTQQDFIKFFNDQTQWAVKNLPEGQTISMFDPTSGEQFTFEGGQRDIQIISNKRGIFSVDKNTGDINTLQRAPVAVSGGGASAGNPQLQELIQATLGTAGQDQFLNTEAFRQARQAAAGAGLLGAFDKQLPAQGFLNPQDPTASDLLVNPSGLNRLVPGASGSGGGAVFGGGGLDALIDQAIAEGI